MSGRIYKIHVVDIMDITHSSIDIQIQIQIQRVEQRAVGWIEWQSESFPCPVCPLHDVLCMRKQNREMWVTPIIRVELHTPARVRGMIAEPLIFEPGVEEGLLQVECAASLDCPRTVPMVFRAVATVSGEPVTAEASMTAVRDEPAGP